MADANSFVLIKADSVKFAMTTLENVLSVETIINFKMDNALKNLVKLKTANSAEKTTFVNFVKKVTI